MKIRSLAVSSLFLALALAQSALAASPFTGVAGEYVAKDRSCSTTNGSYEGVRVTVRGNNLEVDALRGTALEMDSSLLGDAGFDLSQPKTRYSTNFTGDLKDIWKKVKGGTATRWQRGCLASISFLTCGSWHETFRLEVVSKSEIEVAVWGRSCSLVRR
jgi:hypothetical protein